MAKKLIGLRLSDEIIEKLGVIAHDKNQTINLIAKNAIIEWLETFYRIKKHGMMILWKSLIADLLKLIDIEDLKPLAIETAKSKVDFYQFILGKSLNDESLDAFIKYAPKMLGQNGLMWFDHIEVIREENSIQFNCIHNLGESWAQFFVIMLNYLMEEYFNVKFNKENSKQTKSTLFLEYELK